VLSLFSSLNVTTHVTATHAPTSPYAPTNPFAPTSPTAIREVAWGRLPGLALLNDLLPGETEPISGERLGN
jgi:hypothetical protein